MLWLPKGLYKNFQEWFLEDGWGWLTDDANFPFQLLVTDKSFQIKGDELSNEALSAIGDDTVILQNVETLTLLPKRNFGLY